MMNLERERLLRTTQRRMVRMIIGTRREIASRDARRNEESAGATETDEEDDETVGHEEDNDDNDEGPAEQESWVQYIVRATRIAESAMKRVNVTDWVTEQRLRKWRWAGHVARRTDNRWGVRLLYWRPTDGSRRVGRPTVRWTDSIDTFAWSRLGAAPGDWRLYAYDRRGWEGWAEEFAKDA